MIEFEPILFVLTPMILLLSKSLQYHAGIILVFTQQLLQRNCQKCRERICSSGCLDAY